MVQVQVRDLTFQAARGGGSLLIPLCFDPIIGDETNITKILDHLVQRTQESTSDSQSEEGDEDSTRSVRPDNGPAKLINVETGGGGCFHVCWVDDNKKRRRTSTKFRVPSKDLFGDPVPPDQLCRDIARMRHEAQQHRNAIGKNNRDRHVVYLF